MSYATFVTFRDGLIVNYREYLKKRKNYFLSQLPWQKSNRSKNPKKDKTWMSDFTFESDFPRFFPFVC
jgi:hypothetical protein